MRTEKSDFEFTFSGFGRYIVTYTSPKTNRKWSRIVTDMSIIDATKNEEFPRVKDLNELKLIIKN